jgi:hypothetical protein
MYYKKTILSNLSDNISTLLALQWLCATTREVAGSILSEVTDFLNLPNSTNRIKDQGLSQTLIQISTRDFQGVKLGRHVGLAS